MGRALEATGVDRDAGCRYGSRAAVAAGCSEDSGIPYKISSQPRGYACLFYHFLSCSTVGRFFKRLLVSVAILGDDGSLSCVAIFLAHRYMVAVSLLFACLASVAVHLWYQLCTSLPCD